MGDTAQSLFYRELLGPPRFTKASMTEFGSGTVYHYTVAEGVRGILLGGSLWATNFSFLNDPSEVEYGRELVIGTLEEEKQRARRSIREKTLEAIRESFEKQAISEVYVCCFTKLRDDLSQWRAYGRAAAPRYCIGFDVDSIHELLSPPEVIPARVSFTEVIYEEPEQLKKIRWIIKAAIRAADKGPLESSAISDLAAEYLALSLPSYKSCKFKDEEEWRIIRWVPTDDVSEVCFDTARGTARPYVVISGTPTVTELIVLAPGREKISVKAANMLLQKAGVKDVKAKKSEVPFAE